MGRDEVRKALEAMDDDSVRAQMADGDLSALADDGLSDEERAMVVAAADDYPEVAGFAFGALTGGQVLGDHKLAPQGAIPPTNIKLGGSFGKAANYALGHKVII